MTETLLPAGSLSWGEQRTEQEKKVDAEVMARVQRGLAWLEKTHGPGWEAKIDLETLNLKSGDNCVLGQVYREEAHNEFAPRGCDGYMHALHLAALEDDGIDFAELGFCATGSEGWDVLQDAWEEVLS